MGLNRRFVIGDIHGRIEALKEVLRKSKFNYKEDELIILGDVVDGGVNTYEVVEELLKIKNRTFIIGNHDEWFMNHIRTGWSSELWLSQGGRATIDSYSKNNKLKLPKTHHDFFNSGIYYLESADGVFVHGGFNIANGLGKSSRQDLLWDRELVDMMVLRSGKFPKFNQTHIHKIYKYKKIYVGHTTTQTYGKSCPTQYGNLIMMDCGAGWTGRLAIMDIDTHQHWLSKKQIPVRGHEYENIKRMTDEVLNRKNNK